MISQTGGCCRATNYIGMIRKALNDANMSQVAILSLNMKGMNKQPGSSLDSASGTASSWA